MRTSCTSRVRDSRWMFVATVQPVFRTLTRQATLHKSRRPSSRPNRSGKRPFFRTPQQPWGPKAALLASEPDALALGKPSRGGAFLPIRGRGRRRPGARPRPMPIASGFPSQEVSDVAQCSAVCRSYIRTETLGDAGSFARPLHSKRRVESGANPLLIDHLQLSTMSDKVSDVYVRVEPMIRSQPEGATLSYGSTS